MALIDVSSALAWWCLVRAAAAHLGPDFCMSGTHAVSLIVTSGAAGQYMPHSPVCTQDAAAHHLS